MCSVVEKAIFCGEDVGTKLMVYPNHEFLSTTQTYADKPVNVWICERCGFKSFVGGIGCVKKH